MNSIIKQVSDLITLINSSNKRDHKISTLTNIYNSNNKVSSIFLKWLNECHNSDKFNIKSDSLEKYMASFKVKLKQPKKKNKQVNSLFGFDDNIEPPKTFDNPFDQMFSLLDQLKNRNISGSEAKDKLSKFLKSYPQMQKFLFACLNKKSSTGLNRTTINKVIPNFIEIFSTALGHPYDSKRVNLDNETWYWSRKLDGVRGVIFLDLDNQTTSSYSREGNKFNTLSKLELELLNHFNSLNIKGSWVLDGEITLDTSIKSDDFSGIMKQISRKDHTISNPLYWIFDLLTLDEFKSKTSNRTFLERLNYLRSLFPREAFRNNSITKSRIVKQYKIKDLSEILLECSKAKSKGQEGIIIRKDTIYKGKRSYDILKVKKFFEVESRVVGVTHSTKGILNSNTGLIEDRNIIKALIISYKGNDVHVGSGLTDKQRLEWFDNPQQIIGNEITIQYHEETKDSKTGNVSLRFPTFKYDHGKTGRNT